MNYHSIDPSSPVDHDNRLRKFDLTSNSKRSCSFVVVAVPIVCLFLLALAVGTTQPGSSYSQDDVDLLGTKMFTFKPVTSFTSPELKWYCEPSSEGRGGWWKIEEDKLLFAPPAKKDFWRKTYYQPLLVKDDGSFLYSLVPQDQLPVTIETSFSLTPQAQFDQAGIIIRIDEEHWIKTGIEVVDGQPRLSCVVTNGFSDWSTQEFAAPEIQIRVHILPQHGGSFVVEAAPKGSKDWAFIRIAHMNRGFNDNILNEESAVTKAFEGESAPPGFLMAGVFAASPVDQKGMVATFDHISIKKGSQFVHDA